MKNFSILFISFLLTQLLLQDVLAQVAFPPEGGRPGGRGGETGGRGGNSGAPGGRGGGENSGGGGRQNAAPGGNSPFGTGANPAAPGGNSPFGPGTPGGGGMSERFLEMLQLMDVNKDGILTLDEVPEQRRGFVTMIAQRMGQDPNKPINLRSLATTISGGNPAASTSQTSSSSGARKTELPTLVPKFGEKTATSPVLAFGQAAPNANRTVAGAAQQDSSLNSTERAARDLMNKYDKNRNGYADKTEWNRSFPFDTNLADTNRDARLSMAEIVAALGGKLSASSGAIATGFRVSEPYEHLPAGVPDWFFQRDSDRDGQLSMVEYAHTQTWNTGIAAEFEFLDLSGDGVITIAECFAVLKKVDEEKAEKLDAAKREEERKRGGIVSQPPVPPENQNTPQPPSPQGIPVAGKTVSAPPTPPGKVSAPPQNSPVQSSTPKQNSQSGSQGDRGGRNRTPR